jgi:hypothetical protein
VHLGVAAGSKEVDVPLGYFHWKRGHQAAVEVVKQKILKEQPGFQEDHGAYI